MEEKKEYDVVYVLKDVENKINISFTFKDWDTARLSIIPRAASIDGSKLAFYTNRTYVDADSVLYAFIV